MEKRIAFILHESNVNDLTTLVKIILSGIWYEKDGRKRPNYSKQIESASSHLNHVSKLISRSLRTGQIFRSRSEIGMDPNDAKKKCQANWILFPKSSCIKNRIDSKNSFNIHDRCTELGNTDNPQEIKLIILHYNISQIY